MHPQNCVIMAYIGMNPNTVLLICVSKIDHQSVILFTNSNFRFQMLLLHQKTYFFIDLLKTICQSDKSESDGSLLDASGPFVLLDALEVELRYRMDPV